MIIAFYLSCSRVVFIAWVVLGCIESTGVIMSDWRDIVFWVAEHKSSLYVELFFLLFFSKLVPLSPHSATVRVMTAMVPLSPPADAPGWGEEEWNSKALSLR